ncbi:J domain-containing protein [Rhizorhabdus histidinilytica]|uniref:J domain-containing protein n=1 Tax=Rhizorhabdus histidinilytica TaxID=439228 RepID=UPI003220143B
MTQAYPLTWPASWPRARSRGRAKFSQKDARGWAVQATIATARDRLQREVDLLGARDVILSTNVELRLDGQPRSDRGNPVDTGAALYFKLKGRDTVLACDRWDRVADNIIAIAKHIEAIRGMDRWGVGTVEQVFTGYQALPAPEQWWQVLGVSAAAAVDEIDAAYRRLAPAAHPDRGGSDAAMARLNAARDAGRAARA